MKNYLELIVLIILASAYFLLADDKAQPWPSDSITGLEADFDLAVTDNNEETGLIKKAHALIVATDGPKQGLTPAGFRLWFKGFIFGSMIISQDDLNKVLILSGYHDLGSTAFPVAKILYTMKKEVTLLLLPSDDGSRGNNGIIKGPLHDNFDIMEKDFRAWNAARENKVEIITLMDTFTDFNDHEALSMFTEAAANREIYFTEEGVPSRELEANIHKIVNAKLNQLKEAGYSTVLEGAGDSHFNSIKSKAVVYPVLDFLIAMTAIVKQTISLGYPLGMNKDGFQTEHDQYKPDAMIVVFLKRSILSKNTDQISYQLADVSIIQLNWNTLVGYLFDQDIIEQRNLRHGNAPDQLILHRSYLGSDPPIQYFQLKSMVGNKSDWDAVAESA